MLLTIGSSSLLPDIFRSVFFDKADGDKVIGVILKYIGKKKTKVGPKNPGIYQLKTNIYNSNSSGSWG